MMRGADIGDRGVHGGGNGVAADVQEHCKGHSRRDGLGPLLEPRCRHAKSDGDDGVVRRKGGSWCGMGSSGWSSGCCCCLGL
eukprot:3498955-Rhodomonas_salina.1